MNQPMKRSTISHKMNLMGLQDMTERWQAIQHECERTANSKHTVSLKSLVYRDASVDAADCSDKL